MLPPVSFGDWLQQRRGALRLTRAQLAQRVGCSVSALRKIESGERRPSRQVAELLANSLEVPPAAQASFVQAARGEGALERLPPPDPSAGPPRTPASAIAPLPRRSLPVEATPLVGRQAELADLLELLADAHCRLVTLAGPGGIGKTRLALGAARRLLETQSTAVVFVALAPLNAARFIVPAIAEAAGFSFSGPADPQAQLLEYLRDRPVLAVLDNAEHLLADGAGEVLAALLAGAPGLKLLVTSREPLNLQAEWVFVVPGLPVTPDRDGGGVQLFVQRAQRAQVRFSPTSADLVAIVRICQLVDGLPLAIELAAAWVHTLTCAEIAQEIERDPAGLAGSLRDLPARHRSLRAVFEHSWALLEAQEQAVLMRLAVFRGGFTRPAAAAVAGADLEGLSRLVAKSLVRRGPAGRYDLHEFVRQEASERLRQAGAEAAALRAQAEWMLAFAREAQAHLYQREAAAWLDQIEFEHHNARAALQWALAPGAEDAGERIATGLTLMAALTDFFFVRGHHHEALAHYQQLLAHPAAAGCPQARGPALTQASYFYYLQGRLGEARVVVDEALSLNRALGDQEHLARALEHLALVLMAQGDPAAAREAFVQSLALWRALRAGFQQVEVLSHLGDIALAEGDHAQAERLYAEAINPGDDMPEAVRHPYPPRRLAYLRLRRGDCAQAADLARQSLRLNLAIHDWRAVAACLVALASVARVQGQAARAARLCGAADGILSSMGARLLPPDQVEFERTVEALASGGLGDDLEVARAEGRAFDREQAVEYALGGE